VRVADLRARPVAATDLSFEWRDRWSPARNPYAIAVSQWWWAMSAVLQFAADAKADHGPAQQIDARQIAE
jgi:hypothetical protein